MRNKVEVKIAGINYKLPLSLMDIDYKTGIKLLNIVNMDIGEDKTKHIMIVSTILNIKPDILKGANVDELILKEVYNLCMEIINKCNTPIYKEIKLGKSCYRLKEFNDMTTKEYFDIDFILSENKNMISASGEILKLLYSPTRPKLLARSRKVYGLFNCFLRANLRTLKSSDVIIPLDYTKFPVGYLTVFFSYLMQFKSSVTKEYPDIFKSSDDSNDDKPFGYAKPVDETWGWYATINNICNDSKIEVDNWLDKPFREFLKFVSFKVQKNAEDLAKIKNKK